MDYLDLIQWPGMVVTACRELARRLSGKTRTPAGVLVLPSQQPAWVDLGFHDNAWALVVGHVPGRYDPGPPTSMMSLTSSC
jgi:hypothetical protein